MLLTNSKIAEIIRLQIREAACDSQHRTASLIGAEGPYVGDIGAEGAYIGPGIQRFKRNNSEKRPLLARRAPADPPTSLRRRVSGRPITFFCELVKAIRDNRLNCGSMARRAAKDRSRLLGENRTHGASRRYRSYCKGSKEDEASRIRSAAPRFVAISASHDCNAGSGNIAVVNPGVISHISGR